MMLYKDLHMSLQNIVNVLNFFFAILTNDNYLKGNKAFDMVIC